MSIINWYKSNLNALDRKHGLKLGKTHTDEEMREIQRKTFEALREMAVGVERQADGDTTLKFDQDGETLEADFDADYNNIITFS